MYCFSDQSNSENKTIDQENSRNCVAVAIVSSIGTEITVTNETNVTNVTWRSGYYDLNKGECDLNQSKDDSFVERVAKNNN